MMKNCYLLLVTICTVCKVSSQNTIGIPDIINYTKSIYNGGTQNRAITQDRNGIMYFANFDGLLSFDGTFWKLHPLPNKTVVRSVAIGTDNKIYVGSQADIGFFSTDIRGKLFYQSLRSAIPDRYKNFTEVWDVVVLGNDVFFRSPDYIFHLTNNVVNTYVPKSSWQFLGKSNGKLYAQDAEAGFLEFNNGLWKPVNRDGVLPDGSLVTTVFSLNEDSTFITTINSGFFILHDNHISKFKFSGLDPFANQRILTATPITSEWIAVGTNLQGCYIINKNGDIIQKLSREEGLQLNNILYLFVDQHKNLWLGLDNGIDFIAFNNEIKHIYPENLNEGEGYTSRIFDNKLYIGTSNGLYTTTLDSSQDLSFVKGQFKKIPGTDGSAWGLFEVNDKLLLGHHDGAFTVQGDKATLINDRLTYWSFLPFSNILPSSLILAGTSVGLNLFRDENGKITSLGNLHGFKEFAQFVVIDNNNVVWVAHPYRGIFKIDLSDIRHPVARLYTDKQGLPSSHNNHLFKIKNRVVVTTENGLYEYDSKKDKFAFSEFFAKDFGHKNIRHLKEDGSGNLWFIENKNLGVVDYSGAKKETIYFPELDGKMVSNFEHINPYNSKNVFVGAEKGFYHINYENYKKKSFTKLQVKISAIKAFGRSDSLLFGGYFDLPNKTDSQHTNSIPNVRNDWNSFHFEYSSPQYEHHNSISYRYILQGYDARWSDWTKRTEKDYTSLPPGDYTFFVKAKNNLGSESDVASFKLTVLPPWYQTKLAYVLYFLAFVIFNYLFYRKLKAIFIAQKHKHQEQQAQLRYMHQLEMEKSEKEIVALKNEKLQAELKNKNTELASATMHLVQKGDLLSKIKDELTRIKKNSGTDLAPDDIKKIIRALKEEDNLDAEWSQFATHFDAVNLDFLRTIKDHYPTLTPNDMKLCAYLHMNLCSKEIAQHMKISVRGVEIGRYRLRKKLQIPTETNLFDFLLKFSSGELHSPRSLN